MIKKVIYQLSECASYQDYLEDALLTFSEEYGDLVQGFVDVWKEQLDYFVQFIENGQEQVENIKNHLSTKWQFWDILKEPNSALQKIQAQFRQNNNYTELLCKFARRSIETNNLKQAKDILQHAETITSDSINQLQEIFDIKFLCANQDIAWTPEKLDQLIQEEESNGEIERQAIEQFKKYNEILEKIKKDKYQYLWRAEFFYLKALTLYLEKQSQIKETTPDIYFEMDRLDLEKIGLNISEIKELNTKQMSEEDVAFFKEIQQTLAQAAFFSQESGSDYQLKNIIKFAQNINIREQMNPFDVRESQTNIYSFMIGSCIINTFSQNVPYNQGLNQTLTKDFWFSKDGMQAYADFTSYIINAILIEEKYAVLSEFCKNFCNATQHYYSNIIIPFMIHAQSILEDRATQLTRERVDYLALKTKEYETWKNDPKRRKNRAAILTGEIPPEEIAYNKHKETIGHQISILKQKQDTITNKKNIAHSVLQEIQRDANQPQLMLFECKRLLEKFGEDYKQVQQDQSQQQKKPHQLFGQTLIRKYKNVIEMLRKRHDNVGLIRALNQIGDLYFATGNVSQAEENWNDALDTIFQRLHSLKNRKIVNIEQNERNCILACVFLYKLAKYCYFSDFNLQQDCFQFVAQLSFQVFKTQMVNPQTLISFADCRSILLPNDLFNENLDPITTMQACDFLLNGLVDHDMNLKALPLIQIMDYIASKLCYSEFYSTRAKLYKSIVLAKIGSINQSYQLILQIQNEKCGPIQLLQVNEFLSVNKGNNWFSNNKEYLNNQPFYQDQNKEVIDIIQKLELPQNFENTYSFLNVNLFQFAKINLLFNIYQTEIIDRPEQNESRQVTIKNLEVKLRDLLMNIQKQEDSNENDFLHSGPFQLSECREDRLNLMYRSRNLLGNLNIALGFFTRSYFIFKNGLNVIQNHIFGYQKAEDGKEIENDVVEQVQATTGKDAKKAAVKDNKKGAKGQVQAEVVEEKEVKQEFKWETLVENKKRKHLNGQWFINFKFQILKILYYQNRYQDSITFIKSLEDDCNFLNDQTTLRKSQEILARVYIRQGKIKDGLELMEFCLDQQTIEDRDTGRLYGDYAEIIYERNQYQKSKIFFDKAFKVFQQIKKQYKFSPIQNINHKLDNESIKMNEKFEYPTEVMDQLSKKDSKIRKDEKGKGGKDAPKKDAKGKAQQEVLELKVNPLNQLEKVDLMNIQKPSLKDYQTEGLQLTSIYVTFLEDYVRSTIRLAMCEQALGENENAINLLNRIEVYLSGNYNLPLSFKLEVQFLYGLSYKRQFVQKINDYYIPYVEKYLHEKNKKYKKIHDRIPFRDIPRNRYLLDLPNFSHYLKETLILDYLQKSKKAFQSACLIMKGECIYNENNLQVDNILMEMSELILLQREYLPRLDFKYVEIDDDERWQKIQYNDKLEKMNLELESFQLMNYSINLLNCKIEIQQTSLGNTNITDASKIPQDLIFDILESDYIYKKQYDAILFDESKNKKNSINSLDLVSILNKIQNETQFMTFSGNRNQKLIQKVIFYMQIHKFLKSYHTVYQQKCMVSNLDITSKNDVNVVFIEDGQIKFKSIFDNQRQEHKFIYVFSRYNSSKIESKLTDEQKNQFINIEDKEVQYGNFYISNQQLSELELKANNLKQKLQDSDQLAQAVKERDYRRLDNDYLELYSAIGQIFYQRNSSDKRRNTQIDYNISEDKLYPFVPNLSIQIVDTFVKLFGQQGLEIENHNLLLIFRNYHKNKYR